MKEYIKTNNEFEIFAKNPDLNVYCVTLREQVGGNDSTFFDCYAVDDEHAAEQALDAYKNCEFVSATVMLENPWGKKNNIYRVCGLLNDTEYFYALTEEINTPIKALLATHFQSIGLNNTYEYPDLFDKYAGNVIFGKHSMSIGDFAVVYPGSDISLDRRVAPRSRC